MSLSNSFFAPNSVAVVGASDNPEKLGSFIVKNLQDANFSGKLYGINPKLGGQSINNVLFFSSILDIKESLDLVILVLPAKFCLDIVEECVKNKTKNISIIAAGFSEVGNCELEEQIAKKCLENEINLLGPNCLGHISTFNNLNASFADGFPAKGNVAFISQSGAYCSAIMDWAREKKIGFSHFISIGNKAVLGEDKLLETIAKDDNTTAFVFYLESLKNGKKFLSNLKEVSKKKPIVILEPGKSVKAQEASLSHTGGLAPNYRILQVALQRSGAIQATNTREMFGLLEILQFAKHKDFSGKLAIITNAGGVGVLSSDICEDNGLELSKPSDATIEKLKEVLPHTASLGNPIDVVGDAKADRYENALKIICESNEYKNILVLLTPQMVTDAKGTAESIIKIGNSFNNVNIFTSFIGGSKTKDAVKILELNKIINFEYPTDGIRLLGMLKSWIKFKDSQDVEIKTNSIPIEIMDAIKKAKDENLTSLPQNVANMLMEYYKIDYPKSDNFTDKTKALEFCKTLFPNPLVFKLSAPDALHKTEMKGIYLNIDNESKFNDAWDNLHNSIKKFELKNASILIQEMINNSTETIIGVNTDKNFGKIMIFGSGGIYTEVIKDTTLRILPFSDFDVLINETKVGNILNGVRGEEAKAVKSLAETLKKIQQLILEIPEIISIDANPCLVTKDRAVVVDFKVILK
ncbi:MAG: acetate--CoA ligase family protein [Rickettsiales bacterium]|jgi:acetyltransferase|nr:acetate--CoA ligase family protein [Rickettsiales bacterium]